MTIFIVHDDSSHFIAAFYSSILLMLWIILLLLLFIPAWVLLSPLEFQIDTRVPVIMLQWKSMGSATLLYEDEEWWLKVRVLFFSKKWNLVQMIFADRKKRKKKNLSRKKRGRKKSIPVLKFYKILKTFQIVQWQIAFCSDDNTKNARCYYLNFLPSTRKHVQINFFDENYLVLIIRNRAWRMAYAFLK
jgi:hypothetical protein